MSNRKTWLIRIAICHSEQFSKYDVLSAKYFLKNNSSESNEFPVEALRHCNKLHCPLSKISLHLRTTASIAVFQQLIVQSDFRKIFKMSDREKDQLARLFLSRSLNTTYHQQRALLKIIFWKPMSFQTRHCKNTRSPMKMK